MLQLRPGCECCDVDLPPDSQAAFVCSFECTFCRECAERRLGLVCPNCGGELVRRPRRPAEKLAKHPASTQRVHHPQGCADAHRAASQADAIRAAVRHWIEASEAGDAEAVLSMVTPDVVFLRAGHPPLRYEEFARGQRAQAGAALEADAQVEEVIVLGEWALARTRLRVVVGGSARAGHAMTLFQKRDGAWRIARDANLLAPE